MLSQNVKVATDVIGLGLLSHLGNMLRASSIAAQTAIGASLSYSKTFFFWRCGDAPRARPLSCSYSAKSWNCRTTNRIFCGDRFKPSTFIGRCTDLWWITDSSARSRSWEPTERTSGEYRYKSRSGSPSYKGSPTSYHPSCTLEEPDRVKTETPLATQISFL